MKAEEDMAAKKAALLEKRLRREKEAQEKKQQQELDQEQKKEAARSVCGLRNTKKCGYRFNLYLPVQVEGRGGAAEEGRRKSEKRVHQE